MSMPRIQPLPTTKAGPHNPVHHINEGNEQEVLRRLDIVPVVGISDLFLPRPIIDAAEELDAPRLPRTDVIGVVEPHGCVTDVISWLCFLAVFLQACAWACCSVFPSRHRPSQKACRAVALAAAPANQSGRQSSRSTKNKVYACPPSARVHLLAGRKGIGVITSIASKMGTGHYSRRKGGRAKIKKYKRKTWLCNRAKDTDQIQDEIEKASQPGSKPAAQFEYDDDLPGGGQFYCVETGKHFADAKALADHKKSRYYKRRCKEIKEEKYTQAEAEWAGGMTKEKLPPAHAKK